MSAAQPLSNLGSSQGLTSRQAVSRRVLIADDDAELSMLLEFALARSGFEVVTVTTGNAALQAMQQSQFSLLLLNIEMPGAHGLEICRQVREQSAIPILMLSAHYQEGDLIESLEAGADGFVVRPFSPRALLARINALLRRVADTADSTQDVSSLRVGDYCLDIGDRLLHTPEQKVSLTRLEVVVLRLLMQNAGRPVHFKTLIAEAWGSSNLGNRNMLKQVIFRMRRKLDVDLYAQRSLMTTPEGYCWESNVDRQGAVEAVTDVENSTGSLY